MQTDEALFASLIYEPRSLEHFVQIFQVRIPLMVMSYLGGLKALVYAAWFRLWPPSVWSLRVPVVLAGAGSVCLFFRLLNKTLGRRAAWIGAILLATDTSFLLLTTFDWGPVALQHLLLLAGLDLLVSFHRTGQRRQLALAFLLFGLALWDKAIFAWMFSGLVVATLIVLRRELARALDSRNVATALVALVAGASPLIVYNFRHHGPTFRNARYDASDLSGKLHLLRSTLDGSALFGYLTREDDGRRRLDAPTALERASVALSDLAGRPRRNLALPALAACLALLALLGRSPARRAVLFAIVATAVAWTQMALNQGTGGSAHHAVLLWPLPQWIIAATVAEASRRVARAGATLAAITLAMLAGASLLVTNEYLAQFVRHGPAPYWTDAMGPLVQRLQSTPAGAVVIVDWGILDSARLLSRGRLPLFQAIDLASREELDGAWLRALQWLFERPDPVFVGYAAEQRDTAPGGARLTRHASRLGYARQVLYEVIDRHGRRVFEVCRFRAISDPDPQRSR
ncbi:MAG: glycosyltransferase family 39 protein [Bryobacteraceae bacterium]